MNLRLLATGSALALAAAAALALVATPADAAAKKRTVYPYRVLSSRVISSHGPNVTYMVGHTRLFVTKRSWLDAGTEVLPGERHYLDYAIPPEHGSGIYFIHGPGAPAGWQNPNWPLLGRFEAPQRDW
jgi:hypothetical protein